MSLLFLVHIFSRTLHPKYCKFEVAVSMSVHSTISTLVSVLHRLQTTQFFLQTYDVATELQVQHINLRHLGPI